MTLLDDVSSGVTLALDTAVFIYQIEGHPIFKPILEPLFTDRLARCVNQAVTSTVSLAEVLTYPLKLGRNDLVQSYRDFLTATPWITLVPITAAIAERAADLRARYTLELPDALQLAAALEQGATVFITNDKQLRKVTDLTILIIADYQPPATP